MRATIRNSHILYKLFKIQSATADLEDCKLAHFQLQFLSIFWTDQTRENMNLIKGLPKQKV